LTINRSNLEEPGMPGDKDLLLNVMVKVGGYSATDQVRVLGTHWRSFITELKEMERLRQGKATLEGVNTEDLKLVFMTTGRAKHSAVSGLIGWDYNGNYQKLEFGFPFDAGMLYNVVQELEVLGQKR
jgi:hypothetical protein